MSPSAIGAILVAALCGLDTEATVHAKFHYLLYYLAIAMNPRMLMTVDEQLNNIGVEVRVGEAVETVGQAGRPKTITGFQTHTTPVLLGPKDRAELGDEEYEPLSNVLEGVVILKKKDH